LLELSLFMGYREGIFSETSPSNLCIVLHEYSADVTNGSKPK